MRRRCGRARQFFAAAIKAKLIDENPFEGMSVTANGSTDKERFITEEESQKILKACPDLQWRLIFSLCRYGGPIEISPELRAVVDAWQLRHTFFPPLG